MKRHISTNRRISVIFALCSTLSLSLSGCSKPAGNLDADEGKTLAQTLDDDGDVSAFAKAMSDTGLETALKGKGDYTLLAPVNAAFEPLEKRADGMTDAGKKAVFAAILRAHILPGTITPDDLRVATARAGRRAAMTTMDGSQVTFLREGEQIKLTTSQGTAHLAGKAKVTKNGAIVPIDAVLKSIDSPQ